MSFAEDLKDLIIINQILKQSMGTWSFSCFSTFGHCQYQLFSIFLSLCVAGIKRARLDPETSGPLTEPCTPPAGTPSPRSRASSIATSTPDKSEGPRSPHGDPGDVPEEHRPREEGGSSRPPEPRGFRPHMKPLSPASLALDPSNARRPPLDILARIFPHMKRSVLQLIMQGCNNDLVQAIEQVLNNHSQNASGEGSHTLNAAHAMAARSFLSSAAVANGTSPAIKSAFSPITSMPSSVVPSGAIRYPYPPNAAAARGLAAFAMPGYPPALLPNLASMGYSYSAMAAAAAAAASAGSGPKPGTTALHYGSMYPGCHYGPTPSDK